MRRTLRRLRAGAIHWLRRRGVLRRWPWVRRIGRAELVLLASGLAVVWVADLLIELADDVSEGDTRSFDAWALQSLRRADDPGVPVGPAWLREVGLDVTALGSHAIVLGAVAAVAAFLAMQRQWRVMWLL